MLIKKGERQIFYVNSANKLSGTHSNFTIKLDIDLTKNYNKVVVLQASIPKTYYMISAHYNTFILRENMTDIVITVPVGNYNKSSFQKVIVGLLNAASLFGWIYSITVSDKINSVDTEMYTFKVTGNSSQPSFIFSNDHNNCYEQMRFDANSINTFALDVLVSKNVTNFSLESTLFVRSNICQNKYTDNVLQEIYTPGIAYNSFLRYQCITPDLYAKDFVGNSDTFNFYLTDENGLEIDTNGINMNLTVCIFTENDIDDNIVNYIELEKMNRLLKINK